MRLEFTSIKNDTIFETEFQKLSSVNGIIEFKRMHNSGGIAVIYAPNGTGKSSLAKVLEAEISNDNLSFSAVDDSGNEIKPESKAFHIIQDQVSRNVIKGKETDYLVGKQIRMEYELRDNIYNALTGAYSSLNTRYKSEFKVTRVGDYLLKKMAENQEILYQEAYKYIRNIVNSRDKGKSIDQDEFISFVRKTEDAPNLQELDKKKKEWILENLNNNTSIIEEIIDLNVNEIVTNTEIILIERHDDAIGVLKKYQNLDSCVVCDNNDFDGSKILKNKINNRKRIYDGLDKTTKKLLDDIVKNVSLNVSDPFDVKRIVGDFISGKEEKMLPVLRNDLATYLKAIGDEMIAALFHCFDGTTLYKDYDAYTALLEKTPQLDSEELLFIENIINESIGKDITIERDSTSKNYRLKIGGKNLIGTSRADMELSSGEQNFISLAFELLMARHSSKEYIVVDDPISSFDSVYKNKIAYCIIKFLEKKKQIVLTHNTDLIRLLNVQLDGCFNLYILNNVEYGQNGFISISDKEKRLLINLHELIKFFQDRENILTTVIRNRKQFLMSMIPFMRGYSHIILDEKDIFGKLSNIMHGYSNGELDLVPIYRELFGYNFDGTEKISTTDILTVDLDDIDIIDKTQYPLLAETLKQTLIYFHIRMNVEKELVDDFQICTENMDTLNNIIQKAFRCSKNDSNYEKMREFRVFFTSRKTLLNEFNHFEGNMNIFQPAIDITAASLKKEILSIKKKLKEVRAFASKLS